MWILRVNMSDRTYRLEEVPAAHKNLGGRGLTSTIVAKEVPPLAHPLGPNNKLVFAPGIVTGTAASTSSRISVGGKSPLTGGIKEANAGSPFPAQMARMGIKAIVVEGQPQEPGHFWVLRVGLETATLEPADEWAGRSLYEIFPQLFSRYGKKTGICAIGTAGERR